MISNLKEEWDVTARVIKTIDEDTVNAVVTITLNIYILYTGMKTTIVPSPQHVGGTSQKGKNNSNVP